MNAVSGSLQHDVYWLVGIVSDYVAYLVWTTCLYFPLVASFILKFHSVLWAVNYIVGFGQKASSTTLGFLRNVWRLLSRQPPVGNCPLLQPMPEAEVSIVKYCLDVPEASGLHQWLWDHSHLCSWRPSWGLYATGLWSRNGHVSKHLRILLSNTSYWAPPLGQVLCSLAENIQIIRHSHHS